MSHRSGSAAAFSLVELIAALVIFSLAVLGTMEVFTTCLRSTSTSLDYTQAVLLAQKMMEETLAEGIFLASTDSGDFDPEYPRHSWKLEIADTDTTGLYKLEVVVSWKERNLEKRFVVTALAADRSEP